ncbi:class I mannose-6-phosphate isomerase [Sphingopyxis sp. R3-92]|uniref:class I mannose-6-phosphate isomerase n=1 Tax=Sphingopyxis sp. R3-92 TaxID=3158553 RepID=UPI003EE812BD
MPAPFDAMRGRRIGEIWFPGPAGKRLPLLIKYLFTSEKLSIQVHPSDAQAVALGLPAGKEECWYILDAKPGARLGIGVRMALSKARLREAALSGEIETLMEWHVPKPGMLFHIPPGTIHAIGADISLIEIQQNSDVTYRLYDYGRPRELHLSEGVDVADPSPYPRSRQTSVDPSRSGILLEAEHFTLAQIIGDDMSPLPGQVSLLVVPIEGRLRVCGQTITSGECARAASAAEIDARDCGRALIAW